MDRFREQDSQSVQASTSQHDKVIRREFAWAWVWLTLVMSLTVGGVVTTLLWGDKTAEHGSAFDAGWKSAAAVLAVLAAFISVDRLRLSQREHRRQLIADEATQRDAIARQITDLSSKASDQLGSEKAAVRIGGMTDLERLAEAYPQLRQTVVDRICAYLRGPYRPPFNYNDEGFGRSGGDGAGDDREGPWEGPAGDNELAERRLELDVRRTAQKILKRHLHWPSNVKERPLSFWKEISLDLRDATLVEMDLSGCRMNSVDFRNAQFHRTTVFNDIKFPEDTSFQRAIFWGDAWFGKTTFPNDVQFDGAKFAGDASFQGADFKEVAFFNRAHFQGKVYFNSASIGDGFFYRVSFDGEVTFGAIFKNAVTFEGATFASEVHFDRAQILNPGAQHAWPPGWRVEPDPDAPNGTSRLVRDMRTEQGASRAEDDDT
ncbi:pentapeptide repeat-containing protein [Amycolatopsis sp. DG1A-15b]|uniref:pentapeptide repeat-containing protein n=1 Tax=Amycolatopsis sp. DG1A-15b TaxID=3052846 RepID=UPI00255B762D|nr:pentapeptide repeat-containing protein [Amycolatopsis sp. DG1A-15b]WIX85703.1 pentapeptide repeat-containing protein [Amycolatopsis sp. DG1A-15b]